MSLEFAKQEQIRGGIN